VCRTREEAERALASARAVLEGELGLRVHPEKTRIVHVSQGFEFLGYKIGQGRGLRFKQGGIGLYAIPRQRSVDRFKDKVRALTRRRIAVPLEELVHDLNPVIRGGACITGARTCVGCSTGSTCGSCDGSGAGGSNGGPTPDGGLYRRPASTVSTD
jgi:hypothetical protein